MFILDFNSIQMTKGYKFLYDTTVSQLTTYKKIKQMKKYKDTPYFVYVLLLQNNHIYVGATDNIFRRLYEHMSLSTGCSAWVRRFGPIEKIVEILCNASETDETEKTLFYMNIMGVDKVRGGKYCQDVLCKPGLLQDYTPCVYDGINMNKKRVDDIYKKTAELVLLFS